MPTVDIVFKVSFNYGSLCKHDDKRRH